MQVAEPALLHHTVALLPQHVLVHSDDLAPEGKGGTQKSILASSQNAKDAREKRKKKGRRREKKKALHEEAV